MKVKESIYESGIEAFSNFILFIFSNIAPVAFCLYRFSKGEKISGVLILTLFLNSVTIVREYVILYKNKKVTLPYWIERLLGTAASCISLIMVSVLAYIFFQESESRNKLIGIVSTTASILLVIPAFIPLIEGFRYVAFDYKENVLIRRGGVVVNKYSTKP